MNGRGKRKTGDGVKIHITITLTEEMWQKEQHSDDGSAHATPEDVLTDVLEYVRGWNMHPDVTYQARVEEL